MNRGAFVAVVGPSGAGKDTLIDHARVALARDSGFLFVRRIVTRPAGAFEDHDSMTEQEFADADASGAFALSWRAHGLSYGVPFATIAAVETGAIAVCNLSRGAIPDARRRFPRVATVLVTAPNAIIAERIAARGRENPHEAAGRMARESDLANAVAADRVVNNNGSREEGGRKFVLCLQRIRGEIDTRPMPAHAETATAKNPN